MTLTEFLPLIILAVIQGITEWIPVSSSGHLVLAQNLLKMPTDLTLDIALHFGTLMAVFVYFGKDIMDILRDLLSLNFKSENGKLGILLIIATIPAMILGLLFNLHFKNSLSNLTITSIGFAITSMFLFIASISHTNKSSISKTNALAIGFAQSLALIPGISRSGSTLAAGVLSKIEIKKTARFTFLMSIPIIFGANIIVIGNNPIQSELIWSALISFAVGILTIHILLKYVLTSQKNLKYFAIYALLLAFITFIISYY